jgi:hypothetical protein
LILPDDEIVMILIIVMLDYKLRTRADIVMHEQGNSVPDDQSTKVIYELLNTSTMLFGLLEFITNFFEEYVQNVAKSKNQINTRIQVDISSITSIAREAISIYAESDTWGRIPMNSTRETPNASGYAIGRVVMVPQHMMVSDAKLLATEAIVTLKPLGAFQFIDKALAIIPKSIKNSEDLIIERWLGYNFQNVSSQSKYKKTTCYFFDKANATGMNSPYKVHMRHLNEYGRTLWKTPQGYVLLGEGLNPKSILLTLKDTALFATGVQELLSPLSPCTEDLKVG